MKVRWNSNALWELAEMLAYLDEKNPAAATAFAEKTRAAERLISGFPKIGKGTKLPNFRRVLIGRYILVYELKSNEVIVSYLRHGSRKRPWEGE